MSALCQKRTFAPLFDHLVREREEEWRNLNALSFGGPNVEIEQELRWSHDRQVGGICAIENKTRVDPGLSISVGDIGAVTHQASSFDKLAQEIDCGNRVARGQTHELVALAKKKRVCANNQRTASLLDSRCKSIVDFTLGAGVEQIDLYSGRACSGLHLAGLGRGRWKVGIDQHRNGGGIRQKLASKVQPLWTHLHSHDGRSR